MTPAVLAELELKWSHKLEMIYVDSIMPTSI